MPAGDTLSRNPTTGVAARYVRAASGHLAAECPRASTGLIFTTHAALTKHNWLDCGLFLQSLMLAAQVRGLATCPQVSFVRFQSVIAEQLGLGADEMVTCGMSCGYEDEQAAVNRL
jgi:nitroreductase